MVENMKKKIMEMKERTFVLCYPNPVIFKHVGKILMEFEKISLNVVRMRLVCATAKFLTQFISMEGRNIFPDIVPAGFCPHPFVAMVLEGDDAIYKVHQLTSETDRFPFRAPAIRAYSSVSVHNVIQDCELWFCAAGSADDWIDEATKSNHLACALPDGRTFGPVDAVVEKLQEQHLFRWRYFEKEDLCRSFYNNFYHEDLTFFLIKPLAFQKRCVGQLLSIIENIDFGIMGMDLVTKSEVPSSDAWPADSCSSPEIDEYGVALLVECVNHKRIRINTSCRDARILIDEDNETVEICSDLVYMGKPGDRSMIGHYFKFGTVSWLDSSSGASCGGFFLPTLSSLQF